ncbi:UDP-N-acetylglucosamine 2-epimerase (non-hydrolyzing) [Macrococcus armenti]|uniref:non-hydrolyzing UDP-N-acetylglucosamine 2-epimerase n=1 Tax=Macrococcus armenti TaxID=2875764 RepID=UPI001CC98FF1|nr:UDP-N-acetylglucosamine 2-epimerase (non-hydrolyzing) [Macrococcus armenti]UBH23101.1 UDP-N-acetylglucosamine 2-epimerase (non-hydrolyzing) [Macrococcus armenti]
MKILTVAGTRPQLVKIGAVSRKLREKFTEVLVNTGQHYDYNMAGVFFDELKIPKPDYDLGVGSGSHGKQTGEMMIKLEEVFDIEKPDVVLVYGDTNSTLAGAIVAAKRLIPLIHIEAGLRSYNKAMPEEQNRILTDNLSDLLFIPSNIAMQNLHREGITEGIYNVGDVMMDAVLYNAQLAEERYNLSDYGLTPKQYILGTIHRAENTNDVNKLTAILKSFAKLDKIVYLPLHPRTKKLINEYGINDIVDASSNIKIVEPISYLEMLLLEKNAYAIVTDSGGVQKEAYFSKVPCITLRDQTEWTETIDLGWNKLLNPLNEDLSIALDNINTGEDIYDAYGDGSAADEIVRIIEEKFIK